MPLPEPSLGSVDEIVAALDDPAGAEQLVVSMLAHLGVGLYLPNGTPIRRGTETSEHDFYMFEPGARGLAAMVGERDETDNRLSFRDFHAGLVTGGYDGSADDLAAAYSSAYADRPDAAIARLITALGPIDVDGPLGPLQSWLMLLDGFRPPNTATTAVAEAGAYGRVAAGSGWGIARSSVASGRSVPPDAWIDGVLQLHAVVWAWRMTLTPAPAAVHEGHGVPGDPSTITAQLRGPMQALVSPLTGGTVLPVPQGPLGAPVRWVGTSTLGKHGSIDDPTTEVESGRASSTTFTPKQEDADGKGVDREEPAGIYARLARKDLALALYGEFAIPYAWYLGGDIEGYVFLWVGWHETAEAAIKIVWTDTYDGVPDTFTFLGELTMSDPSGSGLFTGKGTVSGSRAGWVACNPGIHEVPSGTVDATFNGMLTGNGTIMIAAYADAMTALGGISTAPMEVLVTGGHAVFDSNPVGELCPHWSHGEMTVTTLRLP